MKFILARAVCVVVLDKIAARKGLYWDPLTRVYRKPGNNVYNIGQNHETRNTH